MTYGDGAYGSTPYGGFGSLYPVAGLSVEERIEAALFGSVSALPMYGGTPLPVAWPNVEFTPPAAGPWLKVLHLRNANRRYLLRGSDPQQRRGILQITVASPLAEGPKPAMYIAGALTAEYPADRAIWGEGVKLTVQSAPDLGAVTAATVAFEVPVSVRYECFA